MPTARELGPKGWETYIAAWRRCPPSGVSPTDEEARSEALRLARVAAAVLKERFGARRVVAFGSVAHGAWFGPESDVDLAVEGIGDRDYWRAWGAAEHTLGDRHLDLIDLEAATPSLRREVEKYGVEL